MLERCGLKFDSSIGVHAGSKWGAVSWRQHSVRVGLQDTAYPGSQGGGCTCRQCGGQPSGSAAPVLSRSAAFPSTVADADVAPTLVLNTSVHLDVVCQRL